MKKKLLIAALVVAGLAALVWLVVLCSPYVIIRMHGRPDGPKEEAVRLLLDGGTDEEVEGAVKASGNAVDRISYQGTSILGWAVEKRRRALAEWLVGQGANPNGVAKWDRPLARAVRLDDAEMAKFLLSRGADPDAEIDAGLTPRIIAERDNRRDILAVMRSKKQPAPSNP